MNAITSSHMIIGVKYLILDYKEANRKETKEIMLIWSLDGAMSFEKWSFAILISNVLEMNAEIKTETTFDYSLKTSSLQNVVLLTSAIK